MVYCWKGVGEHYKCTNIYVSSNKSFVNKKNEGKQNKKKVEEFVHPRIRTFTPWTPGTFAFAKKVQGPQVQRPNHCATANAQ